MDRDDFIARLRAIVGAHHVLATPRRTRRYRHGYRFGSGAALAVVRPRDLVEQMRVFRACIEAGRIVIVQAANTGLTGGSTPYGDGYDREIVIISTRRITGIHLLQGGRQVLCLSGATLDQLEKRLSHFGREPHSVVGSSCIGASVVGGICNNSGGALIQRGPAFTQLALFARVTDDGRIELVNNLDIAVEGDEETVLARIQAGAFDPADVADNTDRAASDHDYCERVRDIDAFTPARFNADPDRLFEVSGSAGKVMALAVRLDTFEAQGSAVTFYVGTNDPAFLTRLRREMLSGLSSLPVTAEYMHRDCFDIARVYGKDTFLAIRVLGASRISGLLAVKSWFEGVASALRIFPRFASDRFLQLVSKLFPEHLPTRMNVFRDRFEHHLLLKMTGRGIEEVRRYFAALLPLSGSDVFECTPDEAEKAFLHRFVAAGAAVRYRAVHHRRVADIVSLDVALPRNAAEWWEELPGDLAAPILLRLYYGHFFCHVFHHDYVVAEGHDAASIEHALCRLQDARGASYPAEHNVGHLYHAAESQLAHFRKLDPRNYLNPGVGKASKLADWMK